MPAEAPAAPTVDDEVQTPPAVTQDGPPVETPVVDDTPAWKRAQTREEALQALLDDDELSLETVTKHQKVSGVIGTHAKRLSQQELSKRDSDAREQRRREMATKGQFAELGQEVAGDIVPDPALELQNQTTARLMAEAQAELQPLLDRLPDEAQKRLSERAVNGAYNGSFAAGLKTWTEDLATEMADAALQKAVDKEIKKRDLVPRAVAQAERVSTQGSPDVRSGGSAGQVDYESEVEMAAAYSVGEIDTQQMTNWYRRHRR